MDLNPRPLRCERSGLPAEVLPHQRADFMTSEPIQYQFTLVLNSGSDEIFGKDG